tara:strand:- start:64 stop:276 length:213 start_codon:yes stop_codon:yes gene_type:complete
MRREFYVLIGMIWGVLLIASVVFFDRLEEHVWAWVFFVPGLWSVSVMFGVGMVKSVVSGLLAEFRETKKN